ncbi:hypothetical protein WI28_06930 [Burkholderia diffusa]|nr:hypothetical protein WI28_06930 [Burkholderia diffusa]
MRIDDDRQNGADNDHAGALTDAHQVHRRVVNLPPFVEPFRLEATKHGPIPLQCFGAALPGRDNKISVQFLDMTIKRCPTYRWQRIIWIALVIYVNGLLDTIVQSRDVELLVIQIVRLDDVFDQREQWTIEEFASPLVFVTRHHVHDITRM